MTNNECAAAERMHETESVISLMPRSIQKRISQLNELVDNNPETIPLLECAKFLKISDEGLRRAIILGKIPGSVYWKQSGKENFAYKIETLPFYLWQSQATIHQSARKEAA